MRRSYGRDLGLSLRMAVALCAVAAIYVAAEVFFLALAVDAYGEGNWVASISLVGVGWVLIVALRQQLRKSEQLVLSTAGAKLVEADEYPHVHELVARVAAQADLPKPRVALIDSRSPNALTAARRPQTAVVALTTELLRRLERHELEAVVAHELAHVANRDGPVLTFVAGPAMVGAKMWHAKDADAMQKASARFWYLILYWPVHFVGLLLLWTISRYREYAADRGSALITGAPQNLISALLKIEGGGPPRSDLRGGLAVQAFCIVPRRSKWRRFELVMDHPPLRKRVAKLEELARALGKARA